MKKSNFYLALSLGVITFSLVWLFLVFYSIQGGFGEPRNTPRTIPFFLGICLLILGVIFLVQYFLSYRPKSQMDPFRLVEIRNVVICIISFFNLFVCIGSGWIFNFHSFNYFFLN